MLGVSSSGFYKWLQNSSSSQRDRNSNLLCEIRSIHEESRFTYGSPRIYAALQRRGIPCSLGLVERLMKENGIFSRRKKKFKVTTNSAHGYQIADNLLNRNFNICSPNKTWASDVTYLWTSEGWLYLGVTIDLYSRRVIGWSMSKRLDAKLVSDSLRMALERRGRPKGLIHHSDRGKEYACRYFRAILEKEKITQSMSRKGDCWDNAVVESFFKTLKTEIGTKTFRTRAMAKEAVFDWIEVFYNRQRMHSTLEYLSPAEYELKVS